MTGRVKRSRVGSAAQWWCDHRLLRYDHHVDHTFLEATHYRDDDSVRTVYVGEQEVARFPAGSWDGVYRHESTRVREKDGRERTAQRLEVRLTVVD